MISFMKAFLVYTVLLLASSRSSCVALACLVPAAKFVLALAVLARASYVVLCLANETRFLVVGDLWRSINYRRTPVPARG